MCKCVWIETPTGSNLLTDVREEERSVVQMRGEAVMWIGDNEVDQFYKLRVVFNQAVGVIATVVLFTSG